MCVLGQAVGDGVLNFVLVGSGDGDVGITDAHAKVVALVGKFVGLRGAVSGDRKDVDFISASASVVEVITDGNVAEYAAALCAFKVVDDGLGNVHHGVCADGHIDVE